MKLLTILLIALAPLGANAALVWTNTSSDNVHIAGGATTGMDDLSTYTYAAWIYQTATPAANRKVLQKGATSGNTGFATLNVTSGGIYFADIDFATTDGGITSSTGVSLNTWVFIAVVWNGTSASPQMFKGTLTSVVSEVAYTSRTTPVGTRVTDSGGLLRIGNNPALAQGFPGRIAWMGMWNKALTLAELRQQQFRPSKSDNSMVLNMPLGYGAGNGIGAQVDYSGRRNNSTTTTGVRIAPHVPLANPFGR